MVQNKTIFVMPKAKIDIDTNDTVVKRNLYIQAYLLSTHINQKTRKTEALQVLDKD